ncbi:unnamed protein product [Boreogadus saida]
MNLEQVADPNDRLRSPFQRRRRPEEEPEIVEARVAESNRTSAPGTNGVSKRTSTMAQSREEVINARMVAEVVPQSGWRSVAHELVRGPSSSEGPLGERMALQRGRAADSPGR